MEKEVKVVESVEEERGKRSLSPYRRASVRVCKRCGKFYVLSDHAAIHYVTKYENLPSKCEDCRKKNREENPWPVSTEDDSE